MHKCLIWSRITGDDRNDSEKCTLISFIIAGPIQEKQNSITGIGRTSHSTLLIPFWSLSVCSEHIAHVA